MRTGLRERPGAWPSRVATLMLPDELEQLAIGAAATLLGRGRLILAGIANEGPKALQVGARVVVGEARRRIVVADELGPPALGPVQRQRIVGPAELHAGNGDANRLDVDATHELADQLHLAAPRFVTPDAPVLADRVDQRLAQAKTGQVLVGQLEQGFAERLQLMRGLLATRLARPVEGPRGIDGFFFGGRAHGHGQGVDRGRRRAGRNEARRYLSLIHISEPTRRTPISYAVFCLKKKKQ